MEVSVVIPAYNAAHTIGSCLEALLAQTVPRECYEVIVVDDGSTDGTAAIARRDAVRVLTQPHHGAAAARNLGAHEAQGSLVLFTDADCIPIPDWIATMRDAFADPQVAGVKGGFRSQQKGMVSRFTQLEYEDKQSKLAQSRYIDFIDTASAGYRRDVFLADGGFDVTLATVEDVDFSFRLAAKGYRLVFAPRAAVEHRHPESLWGYARRKYLYGRWRMQIYRRYPHKVLADSRTPQSQKLQLGLTILLAMSLAGAIVWPRVIWIAAGLMGLFLVSTLPFVARAMQADLLVGILAPFFLLVRAIATGLGLAVGALDTLRRRPSGES